LGHLTLGGEGQLQYVSSPPERVARSAG
jgi:hypothetical protein